MKENLKFDSQIFTPENPSASVNIQLIKSNWHLILIQLLVVICKFLIVTVLIVFPSCKKPIALKHISTKPPNDLIGLVQPTNQTVFSNVKIIGLIEKSIKPTIQATGVIAYDPRLSNNISARFTGRIEKLYLRFNFQEIKKGQRIMDIYSPEILTAQNDLIYLLLNSPEETNLIKSSKQRLDWLGLTNDQIKYIEKAKKIINPLPIFSPYSGHIHDIGSEGIAYNASPSMNKGMGASNNNSSTPTPITQIENIPTSQTSALGIKEGMYIQKGQSVFSVYNPNEIWAVLNIFPDDAIYVKVGDEVSITEETHPDKVIVLKIDYIEPVSSQNASTIKARIYLKNTPDLDLKIGSLVTAKIISQEIKGLWLPREAVLNLGQSQITFIKVKDHFSSKIIKTGIRTDTLVQIISGIEKGEEVAANAQYLVDSESFIKTKQDAN